MAVVPIDEQPTADFFSQYVKWEWSSAAADRQTVSPCG